MNPLHAVRALKSRPVAVLAAVLVLAAFGNAVLVGCGQKSQDTGSTATDTVSTPAPSPSGGTTATASADGARIYAEKCALCHGPNGKGDGPGAAALNPKPRNHTDGSYMNARTDEELLNVIRNGKGAMPPWGSVLKEEEIQAVLKHVRSLAVPPYQGT